MSRKIVFVMIDGLADVGNKELEGKTYLQQANIPTLDKLASRGLCGLMDPVETGLACGSDTAHMSIFQYNPLKHYQGRGSFETMGAGLHLDYSDIAFKCNFATLDVASGLVVKRRVSRMFYEWGLDLCPLLNNREIPGYPGYSVHVLHATEHRCGLKISGPGLCHLIEGTDPLKDNLPLLCPRAIDPANEAAVFTAKLVSDLSNWIHQELSQHPINQERVKNGQNPANILLLRGCGVRLKIKPFIEKHRLRAFSICPTAIIKGLCLTMDVSVIDVPGTTGDIHSDHLAKFKAAARHIQDYDMGFVHIKAIDDLGHDKNLPDRVELIQRLDGFIKEFLDDLGNEDAVVVVTGDHTTHIHIGDHSFEPVPFVATFLSNYRSSEPDSRYMDQVTTFNEISCANGLLGRFPGQQVMPLLKRVREISLE